MGDKRTTKIEMEIHGVVTLASKDSRSYAESNVCDLVSVLLANGYTVLIEMLFEERNYIIKYGYKKGEY